VPAALTLAELDDLERRCSNDGGPWSVTVEIADPEEIELAVRAVNALPALLAAARQLPAVSEADGWTPLHDPSGDLTVTAGTTCLFAVRTRAGWKQFIDAITWDAETEPQWYGAEHGAYLCNIIYWRPLPEPPKGKP